MTTITKTKVSTAVSTALGITQKSIVDWHEAEAIQKTAEVKYKEACGSMAQNLIEMGYETAEHFLSPHTNKNSKLTHKQYEVLLNLGVLTISPNYLEWLPKTIKQGTIFFTLGTRDPDDGSITGDERKLIIKAAKQPAARVGKMAKVHAEFIDSLIERTPDELAEKADADALTKYKVKQAGQEKKAPEIFNEAEMALVTPAFHIIAKVLAAMKPAIMDDEPSH